MEKRKILFLTGTRADFGKMQPLIKKVEDSDLFDVHVFVTGMHMMAKYGSTYDEVYKHGFKNIFCFINQIESENSNMDMILANTVQGLGRFVREYDIDMIVVHGDRVEALAGAIVGALNNILVAHIEGGEISGTVDELIRHSVSKLSHIHFVANEEAAKRLVQMGENEHSVFVTGSPDIDIMLSENLPSIDDVRKKYDINFSNYAIFIYHPVTTEINKLDRNIDELLDGVVNSGLNYVVILPNNDRGSDIITSALGRLENNKKFRTLPSMRFEYFLTLLKNSRFIIGNSSAGVREAPVYGVPVINVGSRQNGRLKNKLIVNCAEDHTKILEAIKEAPDKIPVSLHFGKGNSANLFLKHLKKDWLWKISAQKTFNDLSF